MKEMVVQNEGIEKTCCFYVSDFHLEMILMPYINEKINENITILSQKNLRETLEILTSKMNIKEENKQKILQLKWEGEEPKGNSNIIIIGSKEYISQKNEDIKNINPISVLDCYNFEEEKNNIEDIIKNYKKTLNTLGKNNF
ncbi:MAG: hypothetical protein IJE68_01255 [Clostridia bacterium]|nr:hypothetical protein [Clostridia bacterium]